MSFNIKISDGKGQIRNLKVNNSDTIGSAKTAAGYTPTNSWKWKIDGGVLSDDKTIGDYNLEEDDVIVVSKNQLGGDFYK